MAAEQKQKKVKKVKKDSVGGGIEKQGINLLSDIGLAGKQTKLIRKVYQITTLVILAVIVVSSVVFGAWLIWDRQLKAVENQRLILEQRLATLKEVGQLARLYSERLGKVRQLVKIQDENRLPGALERQLTAIGQDVNGVLVSYEYKPDEVGGGYMVPTIADLNALLNKVKDKETEGVWDDVIIDDLVRDEEANYEVKFSFALNPSKKTTETAQGASEE